MASSAPDICEEERCESAVEVDRKAEILADRIRASKHFVAFTGTGISTSAGIPDFRGPEGAWTLLAQGRKPSSKATGMLQAIPTPTHMALVELQNRGMMKYLVSQNCDGLHRRSGILPDKISELHGNSNREYCKDCGKEYIRDFRAVATYHNSIYDHRTGRKCTRCGGALHDSIINFGEYLPEDHLERARSHAKKADLCLALGSSLTIPPAKDIPESVGRKRNAELAICNLQSTPLDGLADYRVYAKTDDFMTRVMEKLGIPIPEFVLRRRLSVEFKTVGDGRHQLTLCGIDVDGTPVSFLQSASLEYSRRPARTEPFALNLRCDLERGAPLKIGLEFMGHYGEPNLELTYTYGGRELEKTMYLLEYNPYTGEWKTTELDEADAGNGVDGGTERKKEVSVIIIEDSD